MLDIKNAIGALVFFFVLSACNPPTNTSTTKSPSPVDESCSADSTTNDPDTGLFQIEGTIIAKKDLPGNIKEMVYENENEAYLKNLMIFKEYALRLHMAKKQNKLKDPANPPPLYELIETPQVTPAEAKKFYEGNKDKMPPGSDFEKMQGQIIQYLTNRKVGEVFNKEIAAMESKGIFKALVPAPAPIKIVLNLEDYPTQGDKNAKIKIVEISDYLCVHCQNAQPKILDILKKYKDKVSFTQINFALRPDGLSGTYARGAYCAKKQGEEHFWKYHEETFKTTSVPHVHNDGDTHHQHQDGNEKDSLDKVKGIAKKVGLSVEDFDKCLSGKEAVDSVLTTNAMLSSKGVSSTPVFIVNDQKLAKGIFELEDVIKKQL